MNNKIWFNFEYVSSNKILDYIFNGNNFLDFLIYIILILILLITILYIWPKIIIDFEKKKKKRDMLEKKKILYRMKISRDVESEIEEELKK